MQVSRRRIFQAAALAGGSALPAAGQQLAPPIPLSEDRLRALAPVLAQRRAQLQSLRDFVIEDRVAPTQGVLDAGD